MNLLIDKDPTLLLVGKKCTLGIHVDSPWSSCTKDFGDFSPPFRIYLHCGPLGSFTIGLPQKDPTWHITKSQQWLPSKGYTDEWRRITYHCPKWATCEEKIGPVLLNRFDEKFQFHCGAFRWHRGPHRELNDETISRFRRKDDSQ